MHSGKTVKGPNGAQALAYEWRWKWGEKFSGREDGMVPAKVSDFSNSESCATCGRSIVHVFWVRDVDGQVRPYGKEHLHIALGYPKELSDAQAERIRVQVVNEDTSKREHEYQLQKYTWHVNHRAVPWGDNVVYRALDAAKRAGARLTERARYLAHESQRLIMRADDLDIDTFVKVMPGWREIQPGTPIWSKVRGKEAQVQAMTIDQFLEKTAAAYGFELTAELRRDLRSRLRIADFTEVTARDQSLALDIVLDAVKATGQVRTAALERLGLPFRVVAGKDDQEPGDGPPCPRCKQGTHEILLANDMPAAYCKADRITVALKRPTAGAQA